MREDPIFVIGLFRSGTTLMRYILDSHTRIACPPETRFMVQLAEMIDNKRTLAGMESMGFDRAHVGQQLRSTICYFMENYAQSKQKPRWADKTPEYVGILPFLQEIFPTARFIMLYRHPLDQVHSNVKSGLGIADRIGEFMEPGDSNYVAGAKYWAEQSARMLEFERSFPSITHRIRYEDMCDHPEQFLKPMFDFLGEKWEPSVLEFYKFEHDYGAEDGKVGSSRGISRSSHDPSKWESRDLADCHGIVSAVAATLEYEFPKVNA